MDPASKTFLQSEYRKYYFDRGSGVEVPTHPSSREFGYMTFDGGMVRHLSVADSGALKVLLLKESPRGVYSSVARYANPTLPMEDKGWEGANWVFDIDVGDLKLPCAEGHDFYLCGSCHAPSKEATKACPACGSNVWQVVHWVCDQCIDGARREAVKLIDVLRSDLGIPESGIRLYFSGNRGYHVHVGDSAYDGLDSAARLEVVQYIAGKDLLPRHFGFTGRWSSYEARKLPGPTEPGWRGRVARYLIEKYPPASAGGVAQLVQLEPGKARGIMEDAISELSVTVDAGVTTDIHRIFRLPGTLHDKSGLMKKEMKTVEEDPLVTSVCLDARPVSVSVAYCPEFSLKGQMFGPFRGQRVKLPAYAAAYLVAKNLATLEQ